MKLKTKNKIAILGMGYVGLPLLKSFSKLYNVLGYDINKKKIFELKKKYKKFNFSHNENDLLNFDFYIICVPTPLKKNNLPDLNLIKEASKIVGKKINVNSTIIYESTVYPGVTEKICVPILEKFSKKTYNKEFFVGYSPERINPGDRKNTLENITKVISASNRFSLNRIDQLYSSIIKAGTFKAGSIQIAEAAKVIENAQRDINIAFINELSIIFSNLNIDIYEVLKTANTKWNFLDFKPGFVGGHCIGVDPYYLSYIAKKTGSFPNIILAGRKINENMSKFFFTKIKQNLRLPKKKNKILILGITFKENINDYRNSKIVDLYNYFKKNNYLVDITDPMVIKSEVKSAYGINLTKYNKNIIKKYNVVIIAVKHNIFKEINFQEFAKNNIIFDLKKLLDKKIKTQII